MRFRADLPGVRRKGVRYFLPNISREMEFYLTFGSHLSIIKLFSNGRSFAPVFHFPPVSPF
jgi:hypothetical protein